MSCDGNLNRGEQQKQASASQPPRQPPLPCLALPCNTIPSPALPCPALPLLALPGPARRLTHKGLGLVQQHVRGSEARVLQKLLEGPLGEREADGDVMGQHLQLAAPPLPSKADGSFQVLLGDVSRLPGDEMR